MPSNSMRRQRHRPSPTWIGSRPSNPPFAKPERIQPQPLHWQPLSSFERSLLSSPPLASVFCDNAVFRSHGGLKTVHLLVRWLLSAASLMIVAYFVPGFEVRGFLAALIAAAVIGLVNATIGLLVKVITFPLTI